MSKQAKEHAADFNRGYEAATGPDFTPPGAAQRSEQVQQALSTPAPPAGYEADERGKKRSLESLAVEMKHCNNRYLHQRADELLTHALRCCVPFLDDVNRKHLSDLLHHYDTARTHFGYDL